MSAAGRPGYGSGMEREVEGAEGWYVDPWGAHEQRWYSAGRPTALVRDAGAESDDPPPDGEPPGPLRPAALLAPADGSDLLRADGAAAASAEAADLQRADAAQEAPPFDERAQVEGAFGAAGVTGPD